MTTETEMDEWVLSSGVTVYMGYFISSDMHVRHCHTHVRLQRPAARLAASCMGARASWASGFVELYAQHEVRLPAPPPLMHESWKQLRRISRSVPAASTG